MCLKYNPNDQMYIQEKGISNPKLRFFSNAPRPRVIQTSIDISLRQNQTSTASAIFQDFTISTQSNVMHNLLPINNITSLEDIQQQAKLPMRQLPPNIPHEKEGPSKGKQKPCTVSPKKQSRVKHTL